MTPTRSSQYAWGSTRHALRWQEMLEKSLRAIELDGHATDFTSFLSLTFEEERGDPGCSNYHPTLVSYLLLEPVNLRQRSYTNPSHREDLHPAINARRAAMSVSDATLKVEK